MTGRVAATTGRAAATTGRAAAATALLLLFAACRTATLSCDAGAAPRPPANFAAVPGVALYRGAQPLTCGELDYLRDLGVKSILKLNDSGLPIDAAEAREAAARGIALRAFAFSAATIGGARTCAAVRDAEAFLADRSHWPVYVHCTEGKDRTGYIIGLYEKLVLGAPRDAVLAELHARGHRGIRSLLMPRIDRELAAESPVCAAQCSGRTAIRTAH
jgi:protein tyrosine/serine phosphatase